MDALTTLHSRTLVLPIRDIDTDQIIPARFLTTTTREGLGDALFHDLRYDQDGAKRADFPLNDPAARDCEILVAGNNFGCGSSREHAPWALLDYGFRAVISTEFADIFENNSLKNGLLPIVVDADTHDWLLAHPGVELSINIEQSQLVLPDGSIIEYPIDEFARYCLVQGIDQLGYLAAAGRAVLERIAERHGHRFRFSEQLIGGAAIDAIGEPLPDGTVASCKDSYAVLLGAVGGPKWSDPNAPVRPEQGLLGLRSVLGVYANLRPVRIYPELAGASPIRAEILEGVDIMVVRELTGGIYFGEKTRDKFSASDVCKYHTHEIERIVRVAARLAAARRGKLCSVDKANVLETSRLWRDVTDRVMATEFPDIELETLLVDAAAMHLLSRPADFDVMVMENMFGDILTDEASMLAGSLGMLPSASLGEVRRGLYEPIHGSAPDIAGQGIANPCGTIASVAMLLRHSLGLEEEADAVELAIASVIAEGGRTADIATAGEQKLTTTEMTEAILDKLS
jgi:3-isopropylmalate dehydrogenase